MANKQLSRIFTSILFITTVSSWQAYAEQSLAIDMEPRAIGPFNEILLKGVGDLYVQQGQRPALQVEASTSMLALIKTYTRNNRLTIKFPEDTWPQKPIRYHITYQKLKKVLITGTGHLYATTPIKGDKFLLEITGTAKADLNLRVRDFHLIIPGSGHVKSNGLIDNQKLIIRGSGHYHAPKVISISSDIAIYGSGSANISVSRLLKANIAGSGYINYQGDPVIKKKITGIGKIVATTFH